MQLNYPYLRGLIERQNRMSLIDGMAVENDPAWNRQIVDGGLRHEVNALLAKKHENELRQLSENRAAARPEFSFKDFNLPSNARDISTERYREYRLSETEWYRIDFPIALITGATTHRIVDKFGVAHCIPHNTVIRWENHDLKFPVNF